MPGWNALFWGPLCIGLTVAGLVLSTITWRRRGSRSGIRAAAWSLLPLAAYMTGAILLIYRIITAIVRFAGSFVFSPERWAGLALFALAAVLFVGSGGLPRRRRKDRDARKQDRDARKQDRDGRKQDRGSGKQDRDGRGQSPRAVAGPGAAKATGAPADDDDLGEVREILRRRGIN